MPLIDMLTDISSFNYEKVGEKHGEYFGEDKATGFTPNRNTMDPTEYVEHQITGLGTTDMFKPNYNPLIDNDIQQSIAEEMSGVQWPGPVNYFLDTNATGYTLDRERIGGDGLGNTEYKIGTSVYDDLGTTNMIDVNSSFTSGNFVQDMATKTSDFKLENETFANNLISVDYSMLQKARQGKATNKPNQSDFAVGSLNTFDGEEGKFNSEYRIRAEEPGFFARLFGGTSEIGAMYKKFNGNKGLRTGNFGFDEPFIIKEVGDSYFSSELDDGIFRGGLALNVVRTAEDVVRLGKWTLTGRGIIWNLKQAVLQAQQPILQNRLFNPAGVIGSIVPGVHLPRHTGGTFFDFENPPVYDTTPGSVNFEIPKVEEKEGFGVDDVANTAIGLANSALGALGIVGDGRKVNRLTGLYQSRIVEGGGQPESGFSILGSLGIGNNEFEDPKRVVDSTLGPFGQDLHQLPSVDTGPFNDNITEQKRLQEYKSIKQGQSDIVLGGGSDSANPEVRVIGDGYETMANTNVLYDGDETTQEASKYNLGRGSINYRGGLFSVGVSNQLQVPYGGQFDRLNASVDSLPKDFIKFRIRDAVNGKWLIFPAHLGTITDTVTPSWTPERYIGRPDAVHLYSGTDRTVSFDFKVAAFSKQGIPIIQEKMNYLMGLGYPTFKKILSSDDEERPVAPYVYLTIGDLFNNTPGFFTSIAITMEENVTWEIDEGFQIPMVFNVGVEFTYVGKYLPHTLGKHYEVPWLKDSGVGNGKFGTFETDPRDPETIRPRIYGEQGWSDGVLPHEKV